MSISSIYTTLRVGCWLGRINYLIMKSLLLLLILSIGIVHYAKAQDKKGDPNAEIGFSPITPDTNKIYNSVEVLPLFPGNENFNSYLKKNLKWPDKTGADVQGKVIVTFVIERDGRLTNAKVIKSLSPAFDNEALRVINSSPKWRPGTISGKAVRVQYTVAVPFQINY